MPHDYDSFFPPELFNDLVFLLMSKDTFSQFSAEARTLAFRQDVKNFVFRAAWDRDRLETLAESLWEYMGGFLLRTPAEFELAVILPHLVEVDSPRSRRLLEAIIDAWQFHPWLAQLATDLLAG